MSYDLKAARLRDTFGMPCIAIGSYQRAVFPHDEIWIAQRIGSHYLCLVIYGSEGYRRAFLTWLPKRWLILNRMDGH
jgi:hypothetical protein